MQLLVNGRATEAPDGATLLALLAQLKLGERRVAVERNGEIVPRSQHASTALNAGDKVEIVDAIGGG